MSAATASSATQIAKAALRKAMKQRLKQVSAVQVANDSAAITARVVTSSWYVQARSISCYLSTPVGEALTDSIILDALEKGKNVFVPFCPIEDPTVMRMLKLRSIQHFENLRLNRWGIRELNPDEIDTLEDADIEPTGGLDLILVPGLAFDRKKRRLGHGRGYYDRYIAQSQDYPTRFRKNPPLTAALALKAQLIEPGEPDQIPVNALDRLPDVLITPDEVIR